MRTAIAARTVVLAFRSYPRPADALRALIRLGGALGDFEREAGPSKLVRVEGRWRIRPQMPAWPSPSFDRWITRWLHAVVPLGPPRHEINMAFLSVTNRCPLACVHCSAERELEKRDRLDLATLQRYVGILQRHGASMIVFTGGEPMVRLGDVLELVRTAAPTSEFWINTSGLGLDERAARKLAEAGVAGVWLSLDSARPEEHDAFRGWPGAFEMAETAARASRSAGLALGLSLCPTREFLDAGELDPYLQLAKDWGAYAVRVLEPKAVGRWAGQDVALHPEHVRSLETFADRVNGGAERGETPYVLCDAVMSARLGCKQGGRMSVYVDTFGVVHGCPFCANPGAELLDDDLDDTLEALQSRGCPHLAALAARAPSSREQRLPTEESVRTKASMPRFSSLRLPPQRHRDRVV